MGPIHSFLQRMAKPMPDIVARVHTRDMEPFHLPQSHKISNKRTVFYVNCHVSRTILLISLNKSITFDFVFIAGNFSLTAHPVFIGSQSAGLNEHILFILYMFYTQYYFIPIHSARTYSIEVHDASEWPLNEELIHIRKSYLMTYTVLISHHTTRLQRLFFQQYRKLYHSAFDVCHTSWSNSENASPIINHTLRPHPMFHSSWSASLQRRWQRQQSRHHHVVEFINR